MGIIYSDSTPEYVGAVLDKYEENGYDDSDFWAIVWTGEKVERVCYASTRGGGGGYATVDATPENIAAANDAWVKTCRNVIRGLDALDAQKVEVVGREVTVVRGRKVPKGTVGIVKRLWENRSQYGTWSYGYRLLLDTPNGDVWVDAHNVEVTDPWDNIMTDEELDARAEGCRGNFRVIEAIIIDRSMSRR